MVLNICEYATMIIQSLTVSIDMTLNALLPGKISPGGESTLTQSKQIKYTSILWIYGKIFS